MNGLSLVRPAVVALVGLLAFGSALAQAPSQPAAAPGTEAAAAPGAITVGVYTPSVFFADSLARGRFAESLARALEGATGQPVRGRAFAAGGEFQAQIAAGTVDFAVVDATWLVTHGGLKPIAQATSGGNAARPMQVLAGSGSGTVAELAGQTVVLFDVGAHEDRFLTNFLFQGQIGVDYFKRAKAVRDAQAAVATVRLGKAQVTVSYEGASGGLRAVFTSRPAPLPVLVQAREGVDAGALAAVRKAAVGLAVPAGETFDAFGPYNGGTAPMTALRSAMGSAPGGALTEPVLSPTAGALPPPPSYLEPAVPAALVAEPPAADAIQVPPPPADAF